MLCITGTQRSGSSAVAKLFINAGYDVGSGLWDEEVSGGYENEIICAFYRYYLGDPTFPFDDFPGLDSYSREDLQKRFEWLGCKQSSHFDPGPRPLVVKFSYLCMNPAFVTIWHKFRPPECQLDKFLVLERDPYAVVTSKYRYIERFNHDSFLLNQEPRYLGYNFRTSLRLLREQYEYPVSVLPLDELLDEFTLNEHLEKLGSSLRLTEENWKSTINRSKIHDS